MRHGSTISALLTSSKDISTNRTTAMISQSSTGCGGGVASNSMMSSTNLIMNERPTVAMK